MSTLIQTSIYSTKVEITRRLYIFYLVCSAWMFPTYSLLKDSDNQDLFWLNFFLFQRNRFCHFLMLFNYYCKFLYKHAFSAYRCNACWSPSGSLWSPFISMCFHIPQFFEMCIHLDRIKLKLFIHSYFQITSPYKGIVAFFLGATHRHCIIIKKG